jgi:nicotinamidase-related amidase
MPIDVIDPTTALVLIDLQQGITALPTVDPADAVVARGAALATTNEILAALPG